jgi:phosphopantothenoylcysteine decarboxylase/phosphopantothenate--cysteine ligase
LTKHPSKEITGTYGMELAKKRVAICITGSVAAVQAPEIARLLMRHGAEVFPVMSPAAQKIIHPDLFSWATGNAVITELTGKVEHIALAGNHQEKADLILVAPATANTISKIACGIDDTTVTSVVSSAFGSNIPIIIVPAMHETMYNHPLLSENIRKLRAHKVEFVGPRIVEGKAKIADPEEIVQAVIRRLTTKRDLEGFSVLMTAGSTIEYIDPIRVITNKGSGKMGIAVAEEAYDRGADVTMVYGKGTADPPTYIRTIRVETTEQMLETIASELKQRKYDLMVAVASAADWTVEEKYPYKIPTTEHDQLNLKLKPTPKIIDEVKRISPKTFLIAFKAEYNLPKNKLIENAYMRLMKANADLVVVNDVEKEGAGFDHDTNEVFIVDKKKKAVHIPLSPKREVARRILDIAKQNMKAK